MSEAPVGWVSTPLSDIVKLKTGPFGSSLHRSDYVMNGIPLVNPMHIVSGEIRPTADMTVTPETAKRLSDFRLKQGDLVLARRGEMGRCAVVRSKQAGWLCGTGSLIIRPDIRLLNADFLQAFLSNASSVKYLLEASVGSTMANLNQQHLLIMRLGLPPRAEQDRIVSKLEELVSDLDAGVAELKAAQKKLMRYRQSLLKAAVEGALTKEWRAQHKPTEAGAKLLERILTARRARWETKQLAKFKEQGKAPPQDWQKKYPEPVQPDATDLPALPEGWVWASVDQCSQDESAITDGPFGSNLKSSHYQESGPRVIRLQNIGDGVFLDAKAHISEAHYSELLKHSVQKDDVVIAMLGEVLPRACVIPDGVTPAIVKADCARVRVNKNLMRPAILAAQLNSKPVRDAVLKFIKGIGRPRVNLAHIRAIPIALCSIDEQLAWEMALSDAQQSIDQQNDAIELSFKQSTAQRQNILRAAFAGQLVSQDPNDEPASVLLQRTRVDRGEREKQPKMRRTQQLKEIAAVVKKLIDVLAEAGDWVPAQEAFQRCGVADGAKTDQVEALYAELRALDKAGRLAVEAVTDTQGRKLHDRLKLLAS